MESFTIGKSNRLNGMRFGISEIKKQNLTIGKKYNILSIRNGPCFMNTTNVTELLGLTIAASWTSNETGIFRTLVNSDLDNSNGITWIPRKYGVSPVEVCTEFLEVTGGEEHVTIAMGTNNNFFERFEDMQIYMPPFYTLTLSIESISNTIDSEFSSGFFWAEKQ
jgi:hypothetical protein